MDTETIGRNIRYNVSQLERMFKEFLRKQTPWHTLVNRRNSRALVPYRSKRREADRAADAVSSTVWNTRFRNRQVKPWMISSSKTEEEALESVRDSRAEQCSRTILVNSEVLIPGPLEAIHCELKQFFFEFGHKINRDFMKPILAFLEQSSSMNGMRISLSNKKQQRAKGAWAEPSHELFPQLQRGVHSELVAGESSSSSRDGNESSSGTDTGTYPLRDESTFEWPAMAGQGETDSVREHHRGVNDSSGSQKVLSIIPSHIQQIHHPLLLLTSIAFDSGSHGEGLRIGGGLMGGGWRVHSWLPSLHLPRAPVSPSSHQGLGIESGRAVAGNEQSLPVPGEDGGSHGPVWEASLQGLQLRPYVALLPIYSSPSFSFLVGRNSKRDAELARVHVSPHQQWDADLLLTNKPLSCVSLQVGCPAGNMGWNTTSGVQGHLHASAMDVSFHLWGTNSKDWSLGCQRKVGKRGPSVSSSLSLSDGSFSVQVDQVLAFHSKDISGHKLVEGRFGHTWNGRNRGSVAEVRYRPTQNVVMGCGVRSHRQNTSFAHISIGASHRLRDSQNRSSYGPSVGLKVEIPHDNYRRTTFGFEVNRSWHI